MDDIITVKKEKPSIILIILETILGIGLWFVARRTARVLVVAHIYELLSGRKLAILVLLTFTFIFLFGLCVELWISGVKRYVLFLVAKEDMVAIRRSAIQDSYAVYLFQDFKKRWMWYDLLIDAGYAFLGSVCAVVLLMINYKYTFSQYAELYIVLCIIVSPVLEKQKKKVYSRQHATMFVDCDPKTYYDFAEQMKTIPMFKDWILSRQFSQMTACYYLHDWENLEREYRKMNITKYDYHRKLLTLHLRGIAYISSGNVEAYQSVLSELRELETAGVMLKADQALAPEVREALDMVEKLQKGKYEAAYPIIQKRLHQPQSKIEYVELLFWQGHAQMKLGRYQEAKESLRQVAERGGTMAVQKLAEELLKEMEADQGSNYDE